MFEKRLNVVWYVFCAATIVVCAKAFYLQALHGFGQDPDIVLMRRTPFTEIPTFRGAILDRNGEILAADRPVLDLAIQYDDLIEPERWLTQVCNATARGREDILRAQRAIVHRVSNIRAIVQVRINRIYETTISHTVVSDIGVDTAAVVEANPEQFPGAEIKAGTRRFHPRRSLAAHVIGYLGRAQRPERGEVPEDPDIQPGDPLGLTGAEKQFNRLLRGVPGVSKMEKDRRTGKRRRVILFPAQPGNAVFLTLDRSAQERAEQTLAERSGGAVVMDVNTGELLVLASSPSYDLDDIGASRRAAREGSSARPFVSRAIQDSVPSGSVIKPFVALAAASHGKANPNTTFDCNGAFVIGGHTFHCHNTSGHGPVDMVRAIEDSCNVYFYRLGLGVGPEAIVDTARQMGFGRPTGVDLPFEWSGALPDPAREKSQGRGWYAGDTLVLSIGGGSVQVTPLQVAVAMAAIANGGKVIRPTVFLRAEAQPGPELLPDTGPRIVRRLTLPPDTLRAVREGMRLAVVSGTASHVAGLRELRVAAKTGTAEIAKSELNHAWIAGFVPWDKPQYAFAVVVHNTPGHGADVAGPVAAAMLDALLVKHRTGELASTRAKSEN